MAQDLLIKYSQTYYRTCVLHHRIIVYSGGSRISKIGGTNPWWAGKNLLFGWLLTASVSVSVWVWVIWWITNQRHLEVWWFLIRQHFRVQILPICNSADFLWENSWFLIQWCGDVALLFTCWIMNCHSSYMMILNSADK